LTIGLETIGDEFARMYWNQTVLYHLRQAASLTKESEVIKLIRAAAQKHNVRFYADLPQDGKSRIRSRMAKVLTINVLAAFHTSKPSGMPYLYTWTKGDDTISLTDESAQFLRTQGTALEIIANYYWAEFLESCNRLAPKIIQKVARDGMPRRSLTAFLRILSEEDAQACFYCDKSFSTVLPATVDHVIPWSFLLEDPLWDLVLACAPCNNSKSDRLPDELFIERLIQRNACLAAYRLGSKASALVDGAEIRRIYDAAISVEWPGFWAPSR
jgi:hypothetical protein